MKKITAVLVCAMMLVSSVAFASAQSHRHSQRNDSVEEVMINKSNNTVSVHGNDVDLDVDIDEVVDNAIGSVARHDREGVVPKIVEKSVLVGVVAIIAVFFSPVLLIAIILFFIYKRKQQRDRVVMAAINKGVEIPAGYGGPKVRQAKQVYYEKTTATSTDTGKKEKVYMVKESEPLMHKGIMKLAVGCGFLVFGVMALGDFFSALGTFIIMYGLGQIAVAYFSGEKLKKEPEQKYYRTTETTATTASTSAQAEPTPEPQPEAQENEKPE